MFDDEGCLIIVVVVGFLFLLLGGAYGVSRGQCLKSYENYNPQYSVMGGCRIMQEGKLTPTEMIRELR